MTLRRIGTLQLPASLPVISQADLRRWVVGRNRDLKMVGSASRGGKAKWLAARKLVANPTPAGSGNA